jgi:predicted PurR-regulated permease PerM
MADQVADDSAGRAEEAARQVLRAAGAARDAYLAADEVRRAAADFAQSGVGDEEALDHERRLLEEHGVDPDDPRLDQAIRQLEAGATSAQPYGSPSAPASGRSPFRVALQASAGVVVAGAVAVVAYTVRDILIIVLVALFLATGLNPAVEWLRRHRLPSALAVLTVIVAVLGIVAVTVLAAAPALVRQGNELREELPGYVREVVSGSQTLRNLDERVGLVERVQDVTTGIDRNMLEGPQTRVVLGVAQGVFAVVTALVLTLYFVANFRGIKRAAYQLVPRSRRARATLLTDEILDRVGRYVLGNLVTSVVAGVSAALFLWALHVPYAAALGLFVALTGLVPLVGATVGGVVACAVAFTVAPGTGISAVIFFIVYQQFENFFLVPRIMRQAVNVSPAVTIVAVLIGATLLGVVGALLAVPMAAAVQLVATEVMLPRQEVL